MKYHLPLRPSIVTWLLDSDPSIRWQVMSGLTDAPDELVRDERARVVSEGWGARLLALQSPDGYWGAADDEGWMTTIYSLKMLMDLGADPASNEVRAAIGRVNDLTWWQMDGRPYFDGETEPCINGAILATGAYFGAPSDRLVDRLLDEQLGDGGWNCESPTSVRSSFHTTICVLEGLLEYEKARGTMTGLKDARIRAEHYLLERRMLRSLQSGEVIDSRWTRFAFPTRWHYDVLRGLDYLCNAGVEPDERIAEAVEVVQARRHQNGRWPLNLRHADQITFDMEDGVGRASRWITLRALRVLRWSRVDVRAQL
jgi:hypothetical protein